MTLLRFNKILKMIVIICILQVISFLEIQNKRERPVILIRT